jgi:hypothetical protein
LCESEKIIIEFATMTATIIAEMKYLFRSYIGFSVDRSNHFQIIFLMYKHFPHESYSWSTKINLFSASELIEGTLIAIHNAIIIII